MSGRGLVTRAGARLRGYFLGLFEGSLGPDGAARLTAALVDGGRPERAILYAHERLFAHPEHAALHFEAGRAARDKGLFDQARVRFAHAATLKPAEPTYQFALGYALHEEKRLPEAGAAYRRVLAVVPNEPRVLFNLAVIERDLGRPSEALILLARLVEDNPKDTRAWYTKGIVHYERRELTLAQHAFEQTLRREPQHARALYQMGAVRLALGDSTAAETFLRKALARRPGFAVAHYALGRALAERDTARAMHHLRESALSAEPVRMAHVEMARLHERAGRIDDALAELRVYLRHCPDDPPDSAARQLQARLVGMPRGWRRPGPDAPVKP